MKNLHLHSERPAPVFRTRWQMVRDDFKWWFRAKFFTPRSYYRRLRNTLIDHENDND